MTTDPAIEACCCERLREAEVALADYLKPWPYNDEQFHLGSMGPVAECSWETAIGAGGS